MDRATYKAKQLIKKVKEYNGKSLSLSDFRLSKLPMELFDLEQLKYLDLNANLLTEIPPQIAKLKNLKTLNLSFNYIKFLPPTIGNLKNLTVLNLENNQLSLLPNEFGELSNLKDLNLKYNNLNKLPKSFSNLGNLKKLILISNNLEKFSIEICRLEKLSTIYLNGNEIEEIPNEISLLKELEFLYLSSNQIKKISPEIKKCYQLKELSLALNELNQLPREIAALKKLKFLDLRGNLFSDILPQIGRLTSLKKLVLSNNNLDNIPIEIGQLNKLKVLYLNLNNIKKIPDSIFNLKSLNILQLSNNKLTKISSKICQLENLREIYLRNNLLDSLPKELSRLKQLSILDLSENNFTKLPEFFFLFPEIKNVSMKKIDESGSIVVNYGNIIRLDKNPIDSPPIEVLQRGIPAARYYFEELKLNETTQLYEAKVIIVGEPGAGKTSLSKKIENPNYPLNPNEISTEGIDIIRLPFIMKNKKEFVMNLWDFGGQEIYKATHQFFLTKRSLYILLTDERAETDFNYWLQVIELLSDKSPVLIIQNRKQDKSRGFNEGQLRGRFSNLIGVMTTNLATNVGLEDIINEIHHQLEKMPHIGTTLPKSWVDIRTELEAIAEEENYIDLKEYYQICKKYGITDRKQAIIISDYLHDLGVFLHFTDNPILKKTVILRPEWGTDAVYKVLDNQQVKEQNGSFSKENVANIWGADSYIDMHDELLELMMRFELCYQVGKSDIYIAPQLLPVSQPQYPTLEEPFLSVRYRYKFMPKGMMTRFIVRMHKYIKTQDWVWKNGAVLDRDHSFAEVIETYGDRDIRVQVNGNDRKVFLGIIMDELKDLNNNFENIHVDILIPCKCKECVKNEDPHYFKYDTLKKALEKGKMTRECDVSFEDVPITPLIDEIELNSEEKKEHLKKEKNKVSKIFLSYSHKDEKFKEELETHLAPLIRKEKIEIWQDRQIQAGSNWNEEIFDNLQKSDVICLLISPDFIASDFCYEKEMVEAMAQRKNGSIVIPIILRDCDWTSLPFGQLQAIPKNGESIANWENRDSAYLNVVKKIKAIL